MFKKISVVLFICSMFFLISCFDENETGANNELLLSAAQSAGSSSSDLFKAVSFTNSTEDSQDKVDGLINFLKAVNGSYGLELDDTITLLENIRNGYVVDDDGSRIGRMEMPYDTDGAVYVFSMPKYLSFEIFLDLFSPHITERKYNHAAILDMDKYDPELGIKSRCLLTAGGKYGVSYMSIEEMMWMPSVAVMVPKNPVAKDDLDAAQEELAGYVEDPSEAYAIFHESNSFLHPVTKEDNSLFYCTKVPWRVYDLLGINIDSDTSRLDYTECLAYPMVKAHFYKTCDNWIEAELKTLEHMENIRKTLVSAEEIYFSDELQLVWESDLNRNQSE